MKKIIFLHNILDLYLFLNYSCYQFNCIYIAYNISYIFIVIWKYYAIYLFDFMTYIIDIDSIATIGAHITMTATVVNYVVFKVLVKVVWYHNPMIDRKSLLILKCSASKTFMFVLWHSVLRSYPLKRQILLFGL